jgi:nitric oxide reductase NorQ protein
MSARVLKPEENFISDEPYYQAVGNEIEVFEAAYRQKLPILPKGPTGCGKTRSMEHMALKQPLITDLTASGLMGRFLVQGVRR